LSAAQLLIDPEILAYCAIMAAIGLIFLAPRAQPRGGCPHPLGGAGLLTACACFAVVAGYPIGYFLAGPRRILTAFSRPG